MVTKLEEQENYPQSRKQPQPGKGYEKQEMKQDYENIPNEKKFLNTKKADNGKICVTKKLSCHEKTFERRKISRSQRKLI